MIKKLPKRNEIPEQYTWNLSDMYATKEVWEQELLQISELATTLAGMEGKVTASAQDLLVVLETKAAMDQRMMLAMNYAQRLFDQDQKNTEHQAMTQKARGVFVECTSSTAFVTPEILVADKSLLEGYIQELPALELYRKQIEEIQRKKAHSLSSEMEKLVAMTGEMSQTASTVYTILNNTDMEFPDAVDEEGNFVHVSGSHWFGLFDSTDRSIRKDAFEKFYSAYKKHTNTVAALYDGHIKQRIFHAKARNYENTLEASLYENNVPSKVYYNLVDTVNKNLDKMYRYVNIRKKCLGLDEIHLYDIHTPLIADVAKKITYEEAQEIVAKALAPLGEDYIAILKEGYDNRWIDVFENEGKKGGAYSANAYGIHPYVLLNHGESLTSVFTVAHEMGHAIHSYYSDKNQPYIYARYKIFVAEVASICNEILLIEYLLANSTDKNERMFWLNHFMDTCKGKIFRQTMFAEFEMKVHRMVEAGESLTSRNVNELYLELNKKYFGPDMVCDEEISYEWERVPHFYTSFYCYQYSTGFAAAVAIAHRILEEGAPAVERYKKFLSGGGSLPPVELLKIAGVNMEEPKPVQDALDVFDKIMDEFEALM